MWYNSKVENIGVSPSGKASDSDSDITGVRIPAPQPKWKTTQSGGFLFCVWVYNGIRTQWENSTVCCFWTVTEDFCETLHCNLSEMLSKNQERIPAPQPKRKVAQAAFSFCIIHFSLFIIHYSLTPRDFSNE